MPDSQPKELLNHVATRGTVLRYIREGITDGRDITDEVDKSRSSVDRDLRLLGEAGLVSEQRGERTITTYGELALSLYRMAESLQRAKQFVPHLPDNVPVDLLLDAEFRERRGTLPHAPIDHVTELIRDANRIDVATPVVVPPVVELLSDRLRADTLTVRIVVTDAVFEKLQTRCATDIEVYLGSERCTLRQTRAELQCGVLVADEDVVCVNVYDDALAPLGTLTNDSEGAMAWAVETFEDYWDAAEPPSRGSQSLSATGT